MDRYGIGAKLSELRADRSRQEVAEAVGVSISALGMYERGERIPRDDIKRSLSDYYGVSIEALFFDYDVTE